MVYFHANLIDDDSLPFEMRLHQFGGLLLDEGGGIW